MTWPRRILWTIWQVVVWLFLLIGSAWAFGALWFDLAPVWLGHGMAAGFVVFVMVALIFVRPPRQAKWCVTLAIVLIAAWNMSLHPSNDRNWQREVAEVAWAKVDGDTVTFHNVRNFDYRTATDYTPHWETRTVKLSEITGVDLAVNYWGSEWLAHPIMCFTFADGPPLSFSIETRREEGEKYSALGGLYRQYELIYIVGEERDSLRVRTNYRPGEEVYLYHMALTPAQARVRFLEYVNVVNALAEKPRWYNAITTNCTTSIVAQRKAEERPPWDWRLLLNGRGDEMMYERGMLVTGGLPFAELRKRSLINERARAANEAPDFSARIREGLPAAQP